MAEYRVFKVDVDFNFKDEYRIPMEKNVRENQMTDAKNEALQVVTMFVLMELYRNFGKYVKIKCVTDNEERATGI